MRPQVTSYDVISPSWAYIPDAEFEAQDKLPGILGEFVWRAQVIQGREGR